MNFVRPWLAIGSLRDSCDTRLLSENGINAILQLADTVDHPNIVSLYLPVDDGDSLTDAQIERGVQFVKAQRASGKVVLVGCGLGISRSASFAIAALKESEDISLSEALAQVVDCRPEARPHIVLWRSLCQYYREDTSYDEVLRLRKARA